MGDRILITGGAGFIGSHLADELLRAGYTVRALDVLSPQVHGPDQRRPDYLSPDVELIVGDVRDPDAVRRALDGVDAVFHFAAAVGVGQSMYEVAHYTSINNLGTAVLLEALIANPVRRLIVASSMSLYGEGLYRAPNGALVAGAERTLAQLRRGEWDPRDASGAPLEPIPTPETKAPALSSIYALGKFDQERMCLMTGRAYGFDALALRFFNVYGTRQALSNPYTGVLAIFASRLLNDNAPSIFEDGLQRRDFVSVHDVARACRLALESPNAAGAVLNIGSGEAYTVADIARRMAVAVGKPHIGADINAQYRVGDIRHCFADITRAREVLGYEPRVDLDAGLTELASWLDGQSAVDRVAQASAELGARGLTVAAETSASTAPTSAPTTPEPAIAVREEDAPILVTGGAGFIGSNVAHRLLSERHRVLVLDNLSRRGVRANVDWLARNHGDRFQLVVGDVRDQAIVNDAVARASAIYHFAAQVAVTSSLDDPRADFAVNAGGTLNVLEALRSRERRVPLLLASTNKVYGALPDVPLRREGQRYAPEAESLRARGISEDRPLDFHSPYGCSKGAADQYVLDYARSFGIPSVVFRMSCIYGPRQFGTEDQGWIAHFLIRAMRGESLTLYGDGLQVRDALFVDDLVDAMVLATRRIDQTRGRAFNIGGGPQNTTSLLELLGAIQGLTGSPVDVEWSDWRTGDQLYYVSDTRRFQAATGWTPRVSLRDGVARLHSWLQESGIGALEHSTDRVVVPAVEPSRPESVVPAQLLIANDTAQGSHGATA